AMPRMDGLQATRRIKEIAPETTIIALTAHARGEDRTRYLAAGMDDYMAKPIRVDDLYNALRRAVA
ncbi:MAG: response regulator, partial [Pseudomonadota bacterium]